MPRNTSPVTYPVMAVGTPLDTWEPLATRTVATKRHKRLAFLARAPETRQLDCQKRVKEKDLPHGPIP